MDWFLSITTILANSALGWTGGKWWMWVLHAANACLWIVYAVLIDQYGLILLSVATVIIDILSGYRMNRRRR